MLQRNYKSKLIKLVSFIKLIHMIKHFLFAVMIFPCLEINAQAGQLDPSFGKNGIVATDIGSPYDYGTFGKQVLLAPNGAIYVIIEMNGLTAVAKRYRNGT